MTRCLAIFELRSSYHAPWDTSTRLAQHKLTRLGLWCGVPVGRRVKAVSLGLSLAKTGCLRAWIGSGRGPRLVNVYDFTVNAYDFTKNKKRCSGVDMLGASK